MQATQILHYLKKIEPNIPITEHQDHYLLPTICHNQDWRNASHKLYLYKNPETTPLFHCYTKCSQTFNIYTFIQKYFALRGKTLTYRDAYKEFHGEDYSPSNFTPEVQEVQYEKEFKNPALLRLPEYSRFPLDMFHLDELHPWHMEGIDLHILENFDIGYSKSRQQVSIPHYDWRGSLIGIRVRNFDPRQSDNFKYMPLQANNMYYSHPLSLNFYGLFQNQIEIKQKRKVYLYESEKSVLHHKWMFDEGLALGVCGKNISKWHTDMLVHFLGVDEVIIGFDKEYRDYSSAFDYVKKIENQTIYLRNFARVGVLIDDQHMLRESESPVDSNRKAFSHLKTWWLE